jgi:hypothetical protein
MHGNVGRPPLDDVEDDVVGAPVDDGPVDDAPLEDDADEPGLEVGPDAEEVGAGVEAGLDDAREEDDEVSTGAPTVDAPPSPGRPVPPSAPVPGPPGSPSPDPCLPPADRGPPLPAVEARYTAAAVTTRPRTTMAARTAAGGRLRRGRSNGLRGGEGGGTGGRAGAGGGGLALLGAAGGPPGAGLPAEARPGWGLASSRLVRTAIGQGRPSHPKTVARNPQVGPPGPRRGQGH